MGRLGRGGHARDAGVVRVGDAQCGVDEVYGVVAGEDAESVLVGSESGEGVP
jgi:hypothetical protein